MALFYVHGGKAMDLAARLKAFAQQELGFDLVGITSAAPLPGGKHLARWVEAGFHGTMHYMAQTAELRADPRALLPGAASVVCVACAYHDPPDPPPQPGRARIARYARRRDYHRAMRKKLLALGRFLQQLVPGARYRVVVDSAPLLEKELAQRAGLGFIGKNTCLINRRLGSELLLGELLTDVVLPVDSPEVEHCGRCTACLAACPTEAFLGPYQLDARRCIAYLTIEHQGQLPEGTPLLGYLFGCDLCQAVCPWNRHAPPRVSPLLPTRAELASVPLDTLARMDEASWREFARGTPLGRLTFPRLQRNLRLLLTRSQAQRKKASPGEYPGEVMGAAAKNG